MALDRLQVKLFLAIAGANALLAAIAYLVFAASFDRGLAETLARSDQARLDAFAASLGELYGREGGWASLGADRDRWSALRREALGLPPRPPAADGTLAPLPGQPREPTDGTQPPSPAQPRELPLTIDPRLMLFDVERKLIAGAPELADKAVLKPIERQAQPSAISATCRGPKSDRIDRARVREAPALSRSRRSALGMLVAALAARRRARALAHAAHPRARARHERADAGRLRRAAPVAGHDELAQLARDFNALAATLAARGARASSGSPTSPTSCARRSRCCAARSRRCRTACARSTRERSRRSRSEAARLARLVEDLHTLSLSDLGALSYHKEPVDARRGRRRGGRRRSGGRSTRTGLAARARARAGGDRARRRDAARAGVREPPAEQPALYRCAGPDRGRGAARGRSRRGRLGGQRAPACPPEDLAAPDRAPVPRRRLAQPRRRRLGARPRDRQGDRRRRTAGRSRRARARSAACGSRSRCPRRTPEERPWLTAS